MATVYFPSLATGDVVEVEFLKPDGTGALKTLFVDSGFTGQSCFVLSDGATDLIHATVAASQAVGALRGAQNRALVVCQVPGLAFQHSLIAILTDLVSLALPPGIEGLAGLRFLRQFVCWGGEKAADGNWRFFLSDA